MAPLGILLKFLVPVFVFYLAQKWLRNLLNPPQNYSGNPDDRNSGKGRGADNVIDICPECGNVVSANRNCEWSSCPFKNQHRQS